jgi:hypothetical protein
LVSIHASSVVDPGLSPVQIKPNTIKLVFVASPLWTQKLVGS